MMQQVSPEILRRVHKLLRLPGEIRQSQWSISVTRLTIIKGLCWEPGAAHRFVTYLARKTLTRVEGGKGRSPHPRTPTNSAHKRMMAEALAGMEAWQRHPTEARRERLREFLWQMREEQNEYQRIKWGSVRIVTDWNLLLFEYAMQCLLGPEAETGYWAYQTARHYAERYDSRYGTGLIPESVPLVQVIADFWMKEFGLSAGLIAAFQKDRKRTPPARSSKKRSTRAKQKRTFTARQGQFLAFIHWYRKLHRQGPAELDMVRFFQVTPPAVHDMIVRLESLGLVVREPGVLRSIRVAVPETELPALGDSSGQPG
jgi:DNA-binding MarR family transcriptional regulator